MAEEQLVDITPSPRILQVLGDIEFDHWQCLAELIDNGFDEFLSVKRAGVAWSEPFYVTITVPNATDGNAVVEVRDNGRGMAVEAIREAVRAGFSGNDQFEKLGLFGMGFNISTARLGNVARVLSKQAGETHWRGVEIDLQRISSRGEFKAPILSEEADDPSEHGTRVTIGKLKPEPRDYLTRPVNIGKLRAKLGDVYAHLLAEEGFKLYVDGQAVRPRQACTWSESREVTRTRYGTKEAIPAVIKVERDLPDMAACGNCRHWQPPGGLTCEVCGSDDLAIRSRRLWGWVGIQRYSHPTDFGIDFMRNGRKILLRDKRLFAWQDPDDDANEQREYPVEVPYEGRIVGEIHVDHVPVNYQKNAFEYDGQAWRTVVRTLRGEGPLLPKKRKDRGYNDRNDTPLARLFDGFRRNDPGLDYLVPGNGQSALKDKAREWAKSAREGKPDFQTDEKWYEAAERHDELVQQAKLAGVGVPGGSGSEEEATPEDILAGMGLPSGDGAGVSTGGGVGADPATGAGVAPAKETEQERQERFKSGANELTELSGEYSLPSVGAIKVAAFLVHGTRVTTPEGGAAPVYLSARKQSAAWYAFVDANAPIFTAFGADVTDLFLVEIAYHLKVRANSAVPLTQLVDELKARHLPDLRLDPLTLSSGARDLLAQIGDRMACLPDASASVIWGGLDAAQRSAVETRATLAGITLDPDPGSSAEFLRHLPPILVPRAVDMHPDEILDGTVLAANYAALSADNDEARQVLRGQIVSYLTDLALIAEAAGGRPVGELHRARLTIDLVRELVAGAHDPVGG